MASRTARRSALHQIHIAHLEQQHAALNERDGRMNWGARKAEDTDREGVVHSENSDGRGVCSCRGPRNRTRGDFSHYTGWFCSIVQTAHRQAPLRKLQTIGKLPQDTSRHVSWWRRALNWKGCSKDADGGMMSAVTASQKVRAGYIFLCADHDGERPFYVYCGVLRCRNGITSNDPRRLTVYTAAHQILLGERAHLIKFPSVLLPPGATTGSIVNISVLQNHAEEKRRDDAFWALQDEILDEFGVRTPEPPKLQLRNVTQTSVTLEWPPIELATAKLRSLDLYRNGQRLAPIPNPATNTSSKISGLELDTEYTFQLVLRTTAGTFPSELLRVHTHTMTDTSGVRVCFGTVDDAGLVEQAKEALERIGARWSEKIEIDTTHFVCTTPNTHTPTGVPEVEYQRAVQLSIPIVQPHWIFACQSERRLVPIALFGLGATPPNALPSRRPQSMSAASPTQRSPASAAAVRQSMPPTVSPIGQPATFVGQSVSNIPPPTVLVVTVEEAHSEDEESDLAELETKRLA
ncbi:unnamed protein product, partial [Mycena citricolor]